MVEHATYNREVARSNRARTTLIYNNVGWGCCDDKA